jgi:pimeloyl-ACP methyl ester carboxylesterase
LRLLGDSLVHLMDALGLRAAHLFGFHTGNKIAAALASTSPDRVLDVILAGQTHSILPGDGDREAGIRTFLGQYSAWHNSGNVGIDALRNWQGARATVERFWWPQALLQAKDVDPIDVESAEAKVIDYLEGRRSVMPMYDAIFAFDLPKAMEGIKARSLVLELLTAGEAHYGAQGPALCKRMQRAEYASLDNADGNVLESRPDDVARAIIRFIKPKAA